MKPGPKAQLPSTKRERGTYRPYRDEGRFEIAVPTDGPKKPDWLTAAAEEIWLEDVARVTETGMARELDTTMFGIYCGLAAAIIAEIREGRVPPIAGITEARRLAEMFGLGGSRSRIATAMKVGGPNRFAQNRNFARGGT